MMLLAQWDHVGDPGLIGYLAIAVIVFGAIGAVLLLIERYVKLLPELNNLRQESVAKAAETLNRLQEKRGIYDDAVDVFTKHATDMRGAIENETAGLDIAREQCCHTFTSRVLKAHVNYVEFEALYYQGDAAALKDFIMDDLVDDVKRFTVWVRVLNDDRLLLKIPHARSPLIITRNTIKPWLKLPLSLPSADRDEAKRELASHVDELLKVGQDYPA